MLVKLLTYRSSFANLPDSEFNVLLRLAKDFKMIRTK